MSRIGSVLVAGVAAYVVIAIWQAVLNPAVIIQSAAIAVLLGGFCSVLALKDPGLVHKGEITAIWMCICLFAIYGIMRVGGLL